MKLAALLCLIFVSQSVTARRLTQYGIAPLQGSARPPIVAPRLAPADAPALVPALAPASGGRSAYLAYDRLCLTDKPVASSHCECH